MSNSDKSGEGASKWRDKYLDALDQQEAAERAYQEELQILQRALVRVSVAADGQQRDLDAALELLRSSIRNNEKSRFHSALKALDAALLQFDDARDEMSTSLRAAMQSLIVPLLAREPARPLKKSLRELAQEVTRQGELLRSYPELLARLAGLQAEVLAVEEVPQSEKGGFLSRLMGSHQTSAAEGGESTPVHPSSDQPRERLSSGKSDRALFELNPNASLRDSETVSENMRNIINDLLQSVEAQALEPARVSALQQRLRSGITNADLIPMLEEVRDLVMAAYMAATRTFAAYLNEVNLELADIYGVLDAAVLHSGDLQSASDTMQADVLAEFERLQSQASEATDLTQLKNQVQSRLGSIRAALNAYRQRTSAAAPVTEQLSALAHRLKTMESEARKNREVLEEQRKKALQDSLTGLPNREAYNERIALEAQRFRRYGNPLVLAVCDLDYFKKINDTLGHQAGDRVLRVLSSAINKRLREVDFFGRYGGEEFVVIMPETTPEQAYTVLDKIRAAIFKTDFSYKDMPVELSVSIGIAEFRADDSAEQVFERADKALYEAKAAGRNQCRLADG
ncbi:GGDEF domain-containing protein [Gilvimarinus algae]|uniref:diguanylate cyclase n=1 Tax=Gilvimarinus algae TaxID=3058037 RepID=A0ABT8TCL6_9GAMM|nr:GGDEF domain-containing protein [Gilvimarinus sp. SDUM040014]MDO3381768.1 GGDEF domain-containing protein [Gilvimarinus sp. SDUM040014]